MTPEKPSLCKAKAKAKGEAEAQGNAATVRVSLFADSWLARAQSRVERPDLHSPETSLVEKEKQTQSPPEGDTAEKTPVAVALARVIYQVSPEGCHTRLHVDCSVSFSGTHPAQECGKTVSF